MPTRNINLTDYYDSFVQEQIASGRYKNASEVPQRRAPAA